MQPAVSTTKPDWLAVTENALRQEGYCLLESALSLAEVKRYAIALLQAQIHFNEAIDETRRMCAGELGVVRLLMSFDPCFTELLDLPLLRPLVETILSDKALLHLQNGFVLPPKTQQQVFQTSFHRDFPRVLGGFLASFNTLFVLSDFTEDNGALRVVPGSHQQPQLLSQVDCLKAARPVICPAGSIIVFDSTLWHAAGHNNTAEPRLAINQQYTFAYFKQQIDLVRALGEDFVLKQSPWAQQLLGYTSRVVSSLDEFYQPEDSRYYQKGQG